MTPWTHRLDPARRAVRPRLEHPLRVWSTAVATLASSGIINLGRAE
ncbi:hypothetical protein AB0B45_47015 [Nonomuraea sp. NPDC049152]